MTIPRKLTVTSTFGIYPPLGGGQLRVFHLCRHLAARCPVEVIALVAGDEPRAARQLAPGLREVRVPKTERHVVAEAELEREAGVPVTDAAFPELFELTPEYIEAVASSAVAGGAFMVSHPYTLPAITAVRDDVRLWYDVHNIEADLKASVLASNDVGRKLLSATRAIERECCERSELVLPSSGEDADRLRTLYRVADAKITLVPNGVDSGSIRFLAPSERRALRGRLRMQKPLALFLGSWHPPNVRAARQVIKLASRMRQLEFALVGSVCEPLKALKAPGNVTSFGPVDDELKDALLSVAAVALNPMREGSGTNIKMLDYLAAGVPVVSSEIGARGLGLEPGRDALIVPVRRFASAIRTTLDEPVEIADRRARGARLHVEQGFDWGAIAGRLLERIGAGSYGGELTASPPAVTLS